VDLICKTAQGLVGVEIKSAATWHNQFAKQLIKFAANNHPLQKSLVVYNGIEIELSNGVRAVSYDRCEDALSG
jgi:hypothetical protein